MKTNLTQVSLFTLKDLFLLPNSLLTPLTTAFPTLLLNRNCALKIPIMRL